MPDPLRVLIGQDQPEVGEGLRAQIEGLGHKVLGIARDGRDVVSKADALTPDLILLSLRGLDALHATRQIMARRPVPIIIITDPSDPELLQQAVAVGIMGYLIRPVERQDLGPALTLAVARFADLMALRQDVRSLKEALLLRQQVERAKGILVERVGLSEAEAHRALQALAQRERCPLADAANRVIAANKFYEALEQMD